MTETWTLVPPWSKPPLSMNDRTHWAVHAKKTAECREWALDAAVAALVPPLVHCIVEMVWYVPDRRRRDEENPVASFKPVCDGLVDAQVVPDDVPKYMTKLMPRVEYRKGDSGVEIVITGEPVVTE